MICLFKTILQLKPTPMTCMMVVAPPWSMLEPWGFGGIFNTCESFRLWMASNPGAITHMFTCWMEHSSSSSCPLLQTAILCATRAVFQDLDWGELYIRQMLAARVRRMETENHNEGVQAAVSDLMSWFPEIRQLWLQSIQAPFWIRSWLRSQKYRCVSQGSSALGQGQLIYNEWAVGQVVKLPQWPFPWKLKNLVRNPAHSNLLSVVAKSSC